MNPTQSTLPQSKQARPWWQRLHLDEVPSTVWTLGLVSMLMNISSVMISSLSPLFMMNVLKATATQVGMIRGVTEGIAYFTKIFSGVLSDYIGKRKLLIVIGYSFAACTKPIFATTTNIFWYGTAQFLDRVSNGMRNSPRDALIADTAPSHLKGTCFGLRQGFATAGAVIGTIIAMVAMVRTSDNYQLVYWIATIPVVLAVILLIMGVKDPVDIPRRKDYTQELINFGELKKLGKPYWLLMLVLTIFMLSRFSEAFLVMRAKNLNMKDSYAPLVLMFMNIAYTLSGNAVAAMMDKVDRRIFLWIGFPTLIVAYAILGWTNDLNMALVGVFIYGLHMGATQGVFFAMVADLTPRDLRATSFGIFSLICGLALMVSSTAAGWITDHFGIALTFTIGGGIALVSTVLLSCIRPTNQPLKVMS